MVAALPFISLVASAPLVYVIDTLWQLVLGQDLEPVEGLHLPLGGQCQGSQVRWLRLCPFSRWPGAAGGCSNCREWGLFTPPSTMLQLQIGVAKFTLKSIVECSFSFSSNSCCCCEHIKPTWNNPLWRWEENRGEKNPQSRASALIKSYEGREKALPECLDFKELDTCLSPPPTLLFWFWLHRRVLKRLSVLGTDGYGIQ